MLLFVFLLRNFNVIGPLDPNGGLIGPMPWGPMNHQRQLYKNVYLDHTDEENHSNILLKYVNIIVCHRANEYPSLTINDIHIELNIIHPSSEVLELSVYMFGDCTFDFQVTNLYIRCSNLTGWMLRTFSIRETRTMMTPFKSLVLFWLDYASQLWSPHVLKSIYLNGL